MRNSNVDPTLLCQLFETSAKSDITGLHRRSRFFGIQLRLSVGWEKIARACTKLYSSRGSQKSRLPPVVASHGAFMSHDSPWADSSDRSSSTARFIRTQSSRTSARALAREESRRLLSSPLLSAA